MKRKILSMLMMMLFLGASLVSAQENRVYWGPKVGVNISAITKSGFSSWKGGANVGVLAMYRYNDYLGLQTELLFSMMGANFDGGNMHVNYLTLPVIAKVYLIDNLSLELGPQLGVKVYDKINVYEGVHIKNSKAFNGFELMFAVGLGYEFKFGMIADVRYGIGLTNSIKNSYIIGDNSKNEMFQISLGWKF